NVNPTIIPDYETSARAYIDRRPCRRVRHAFGAAPSRGTAPFLHVAAQGRVCGAARESAGADRRRRRGPAGGDGNLFVREVPPEQPVLLPHGCRDAARDPRPRRPGEERLAL